MLVYPPMFEQTDLSRRWLARLVDAIGLVPAGTPHQRLATGTPAALRRYDEGAANGPPVLIVPAPIKSPGIWDLEPTVSVVRRHLEAGYRVYMVEWPRPGADSRHLDLQDYVEDMLLACVEAVGQETGEQRLFLSGHSIGGLFATLFCAAHPDRVRGLVALGAPLNFGPRIGGLGRLVSMVPDTRALTAGADTVPGSLLNLISTAASPQTFLGERAMDWLTSLGDARRMRLHLLVERWALEETAMPSPLFETLVDRLYRDNAFVAGELRIGARTIGPGDVRCPLALVVSRHCDIAPPEAAVPVLDKVAGEDHELFWCEPEAGVSLQHVAMLVGYNAHRHLWPRLLSWMAQR